MIERVRQRETERERERKTKSKMVGRISGSGDSTECN